MIEITRFRLAPGVDEAEALALRRRAKEEFAYQQPGLLWTKTARGEDGSWIIINQWRSSADLDAADARWEHYELAQASMAVLDMSSVSVERYQDLD